MRIAVTIALAGLAASSCGGDGSSDNSASLDIAAASSSGSGGSASACDLLTKADAERALGRPVEKLPASGGPGGLDICQYGYQGERLTDTGQATVTVQPLDLASLKQGVVGQGYSTEPVFGLGDEAFWSAEAGLHVGKGERSAIYLVGSGDADAASNKQRAIDLARATVGRL